VVGEAAVPVKRRIAKGRAHRITDGAVEAWLAGNHVALHRALGLKPWETSPFDVDGDGEVVNPPLIAIPDDWSRSEDAAIRLRRELSRHGPAGRVGRHGLPWQPGDDDDG
jgi:hypothetical protein